MPSQTRAQVLQYTLLSRDVLNAEDMDLYELVHLSGVVMDPNVYKILLDLLRMNVTPTAIEKMLKSMVSSSQQQKHGNQSELSMGPPSSLPVHAPSAPRSHSSSSSSVTSSSHKGVTSSQKVLTSQQQQKSRSSKHVTSSSTRDRTQRSKHKD